MLGFMLTLILMGGSQDPVQDPVSEPSRTQQLEEAREQKAGNLQKPTRTFLERGLYEFKERRVMERFQEGFHGFHPILGGIRSGSGFGGGTYIENHGIRASLQGSLKGYQKYEVRFTVPQIISERFFADFRATYRDYSQERFFGSGKESRKEDQTSYRLDDTNYVGRFGFTPAKHVKAGVITGWLETNVGSGRVRGCPPSRASLEMMTLRG
jgi:hypothetical protein